LRSNQQMADAMRGATRAMASMNRGLNLPQIQRIMNEFEKESAAMDMKEEMMSDAVDDVMDDEAVDEEEEGDKILKEVLDEIGVGLSQELQDAPTSIASASVPLTSGRQAVALGAHDGPPLLPPGVGGGGTGVGGTGVTDDDLEARLANLRK